jgi:signal transduction histidine kinase/CheY-like chemotaxis protein
VTVLNVTDQKNAERALRESEQKFRSIVEQSTDGITVVDEEGFVIEWNRGSEQITGIKREKAVGATLWDLMGTPTFAQQTLGTNVGATRGVVPTPDNRVYYEKTLKDILRTGDIPPDMRFMEVTLCRADGGHCVIQQVVSPVKTDRGHMLIITMRDVTELKQMEEERLKTGKLESVGLLAGGIAHDFNNILVSILGNISLAKSYIDKDHQLVQSTDSESRSANPVMELLVKAEKAGERARDLTRQLLTFSKGGTPVKETLSVEEIIRESAEFSLRGSNIRCEFSFPFDLKPVEVDRSQIIQVMNNLILNADQAMQSGGVIRIQAENMKVTGADGLPLPERDYIRITVCDQGVGISPENLPKIFDPYFTTKAEGSGLGLTISYSIVRNHNGYINAESEKGVGTVFTIYLPAAGGSSDSGQSNAVSIPNMHGRILVMDDEKGVREVVAEMLIHLGHEVEVVPDGREAVRRYREARESGRPFNAVIMDLTIPGGMGGKATVRELLTYDPGCRVIVSSGYSRDSILSDYVKYGFTGVIAKPYRIEELREVVNRVLAGA